MTNKFDVVSLCHGRDCQILTVDVCDMKIENASVDISLQGRSCKQICWPPGVGGLQRVGLDPGQYDHHPHGVVHVGQLQDV